MVFSPSLLVPEIPEIPQVPRKRWWPAKQNVGPCSVDGCANLAATSHMCNMHYLRRYRHGAVGPIDEYREYHDLTDTKEYRAWQNMLARCRNPNNPGYRRYGGRGITVCKRWTKSFSAFLTDIGPAPSPLHSIDRTDNDGNYEPGNCRWVTFAENVRNSSTAKLTLEKAAEIRAAYAAGKYRLRRDLAAAYGIAERTLYEVLSGKRWAR